jgi:hypothetical protein
MEGGREVYTLFLLVCLIIDICTCFIGCDLFHVGEGSRFNVLIAIFSIFNNCADPPPPRPHPEERVEALHPHILLHFVIFIICSFGKKIHVGVIFLTMNGPNVHLFLKNRHTFKYFSRMET